MQSDALGIWSRVLDVPPAPAVDVAVRSGTDPPPVLTAPIGQIVLALATRSGPIGDLVPWHARRRHELVDQLVSISTDVIVRCRQLTARDAATQGGAVLNDQGVGRQMIDAGRHGSFDRSPEVVI